MGDFKIKEINSYKWKIEKDEDLGMRVPGIVFADKELMEQAMKENTLNQVVNVANLPGILEASFAMPDIHYGYGFPIGGVAAMDENEGVISPGGVGFDISCGVRVLRTNIDIDDIKKQLEKLMYGLFTAVPKGVGSKSNISLSENEMSMVFEQGIGWAIKKGYGRDEDRYFIEENGCMEGANPDFVSKNAINRGKKQLGSLGSGNHFLEVQKVSKIYDKKAAEVMGLNEGQLTIMIHTGSRGLGHQICSDYLKLMQKSDFANKIKLPDRQLACVPAKSQEGKRYYGAMACAANYAIVNRQCISHQVRAVFEDFFKKPSEKLDLGIVYDVSHNLARFEEHMVNGSKKNLCVHRKGATRAFGPGSKNISQAYSKIGQPVIIPGDMGSCSYILVGTKDAMEESFGSTCHGAGRMMSRSKAKKTINGTELKRYLLEKRNIIVLAQSMSGLAEEAPDAYKDVSRVVEIAHNAKISRKVLKLVPLGVIKG